jgi:predicted Zn-dependent protease
MLLKEKILEEAGGIIKSAEAESAEVVVHRESTSTLRYAGSSFHQGGRETDCTVYIRVITGRKVGVASTNSLEPAELKDCLKRALSIAGHTGKEPFDLRLPGPSEYPPVESWFERTAAVTEKEKADLVAGCFKKAWARGVQHSGSLTTSEGEVAVLNSNGVSAYHPYTLAHLSAVATKGAASGYSSAVSKDFSGIDIPGVLDRSVEDCLAGLDTAHLEPGAYRVLFSPHAVSELLEWLSYTGFGSKNFHEGTSFLSGRLGEKVTGQSVTVYDDGLSPSGMAAPFDLEGVPKKRLSIIEKGVALGVAYDTFTGSMEGGRTTGHAGYPDETEGPSPAHLFMDGGSMDFDEMLRGLDNGVFVKSFHYVNGLLNPREGLMTGMTRHGTFRVEGGRVKRALNPVRFTENIVKAFERIEGLSKSVEVFGGHQGSFLSSISVPHLLISSFRFTS